MEDTLREALRKELAHPLCPSTHWPQPVKVAVKVHHISECAFTHLKTSSLASVYSQHSMTLFDRSSASLARHLKLTEGQGRRERSQPTRKGKERRSIWEECKELKDPMASSFRCHQALEEQPAPEPDLAAVNRRAEMTKRNIKTGGGVSSSLRYPASFRRRKIPTSEILCRISLGRR